MAYCEISHDDEEQAKSALGASAKPTGRIRWWKGHVDMSPVLQSEWANEFDVGLWFDVPTIRTYD